MRSRLLCVVCLITACSNERASFDPDSKNGEILDAGERDESRQLDARSGDHPTGPGVDAAAESNGDQNATTDALDAAANEHEADDGKPGSESEPDAGSRGSGESESDAAGGSSDEERVDADAPTPLDAATGDTDAATNEPCKSNDTRVGDTSCGLNGRGSFAQSCVDAHWVDNVEACLDADVCTDHDKQVSDLECGKSGYVQQLCVAGQWVNQGSTCIECQRDLVFESPNLELKLREYLGVDGPISPLRVVGLTSLEVAASSIDDLGGIECLTSLQTLDIGVNQISDLSPLSALTNLAYLTADRNVITDLSPLAQLPQLISLRASYNTISSVEPLSGSTQLADLWLEFNWLTEVGALADLTELEVLRLAGNQIADVTALGGLTQLTQLELYSNAISDVSALTSLTQLETLSLTGNLVDCDAPELATLESFVEYLTTDCE